MHKKGNISKDLTQERTSLLRHLERCSPSNAPFMSDVIVSNPCPAVQKQLVEPRLRRDSFQDIGRFLSLEPPMLSWSEEERSPPIEDTKSGKHVDVETTTKVAYNRHSEARKQLIQLATGHVGRTGNVQVGDDVMIFQGARTPFIVTSLGNMELEDLGMRMVCSIIKDVCIIGAMDREIVEQNKKERKMAELIYLI